MSAANDLRSTLASLQRRLWEPEVPPVRIGEARPVPLSVGIATFDDFDGAYFTVSSLLLHHSEDLTGCEIVILDNNPRGRDARHVAGLADASSGVNVRYVPYEKVHSTAVRDVLFREATGDVVVVLDSHVLLEAGSIAALKAYFSVPEHQKDMVQGPMLHGNGVEVAATQMLPEFREGMFGFWHTDPRGLDRDAPAFDIDLHGLAVFAMRREAWPGINPAFQGFGGEEGYIQEKVRRAGGRTVCLPAVRWMHRFVRPAGAPYPNLWSDRINNYMVGWAELGWDLDLVVEHFSSHLGEGFPSLYARTIRGLEHPVRLVDGVMVLSDDSRIGPWQTARAELERAGVAVNRVPVIPTDGDESVARAVREALDDAVYRGWKSVLLLDESWPLDLALFHAVAQVASAGDRALQIGSGRTVGFLPAPLMFGQIPPSRPDHSLSDWLDELDAVREPALSRLAIPRGGGRTGLADVLAETHIICPAGQGDAEWLAAYQRFADLGMGLATHRKYLVERPGRPADEWFAAQVARGVATWGEQSPTGPILFLPLDALVLEGFDSVLAHALSELAEIEWDVLSLHSTAQSAGIEMLPGSAFLGRRERGHGASALVVHPRAVRAVEVFEDRTKPLESVLDQAQRTGHLRVLSVTPGCVTTEAELPGSEENRWRHRYERLGR